MYKSKQNLTPLICVIPYEIFKTFEERYDVDLTFCKGTVEKEPDREIWFGFVNRRPMRFTYRETDQKTTYAPCNIEKVKQKLKSTLENQT